MHIFSGPFLCALLQKLDTFMQNTFYVNLLLTGLCTRLACYRQPLLRSYLLNHTLVFQPTVKSLFQVLGTVKHKLDRYSSDIGNFDQLLSHAREFLCWREQLHDNANLTLMPKVKEVTKKSGVIELLKGKNR